MRQATASAVVAVVLSAAGALPAAQAPSPEQIAAQVQARYDKVRDFTANFAHTYEGGVLRRKITETGVVQVKKPGRMRWEYRKPDHKLFVSDGRQMYFHEVAPNQVTIFQVPQGDEATTAVQFLAGKGHITRDFTVAAAEGGTASTYMLRLTPRSAEPDYDWLLLEVDRQSFQMRSLSAADNQGGRNTYTFTNLRENTGLADRVFNFTIPRGADVVRADKSR
jgi:outer membrane lipoprotein carrier protein